MLSRVEHEQSFIASEPEEIGLSAEEIRCVFDDI